MGDRGLLTCPIRALEDTAGRRYLGMGIGVKRMQRGKSDLRKRRVFVGLCVCVGESYVGM